MARIFITGSSTGLGLMSAQLLVEQGHQVVLHARNADRAADARDALPQADAVVIGDVTTIAGAKSVAQQANDLGRFDAVIHNVAVGYREPRRIETEDGLPEVFAANTLAPYILTALIERPARLVYLSSGLHRGASANLDDVSWARRRWSGSAAYSESKLHNVLLAFGIGRRWPDVFSNAVEPGWVATRMGGKSAADPGLAGRQRRHQGEGHRQLFLSRPEARGESRSRRRTAAGPALCDMRGYFWRESDVTNRPQSATTDMAKLGAKT